MSLVTVTAAGDWPSVSRQLRQLSRGSGALNATAGPAAWTPLHFVSASSSAPSELLPQLVSLGADVEARASSGSTPLHLAAWHGIERHVRLLLESGAEVEARTRAGRTAMHFAARRGHVGVLRVLVEEGGCDVGGVDGRGIGALEFAADGGHVEMVGELVRLGGGGGVGVEAALAVARANNDSEMVRVLEDLGGGEVGGRLGRWGRVVGVGERVGERVGGFVRGLWAGEAGNGGGGGGGGGGSGAVVRGLSGDELGDVMAEHVRKAVAPGVREEYVEVVRRGVSEYGLTGDLLAAERPAADVLVAEVLEAGGWGGGSKGALFHALVNFVEGVRGAEAGAGAGALVPSGVLRDDRGMVRREVYAAVGAGVLVSLLMPLSRRAA